MRLLLHVNRQPLELEITVNARLLDVLRREGYFGVKHGRDDSTCACVM